MEVPGEEHDPHQENESDEYRENSRSDEFALLLAKAIKVWERTVEITELAKATATEAKLVNDLEEKIKLAKADERPTELLLAESHEASEKKAVLLEQLFQIIWPDLFYLAYKCSKSFAEAKDTAQEAAIQIVKGIHKFVDLGGGFRPWYATVTSRASLVRYRWWTRWMKRGENWQQSRLLNSSQESDGLSDTSSKLFDDALTQLSEECRKRFKNLRAAGTKLGGHGEIAKSMAEEPDTSKRRTYVCVEQFRATYRALSEAQAD